MKSSIQFSSIVAACITLLSANAFAHDGDHGPGLAANLWHLVTQPDHLLVFFAVALPVALLVAVARARKAKQLNHSE